MNVNEELQWLHEAEPLGTAYTTGNTSNNIKSSNKRNSSGSSSAHNTAGLTTAATSSNAAGGDARFERAERSAGGAPAAASYGSADTAGDLWLLDSRKGSAHGNGSPDRHTNPNNNTANVSFDTQPGAISDDRDTDYYGGGGGGGYGGGAAAKGDRQPQPETRVSDNRRRDSSASASSSTGGYGAANKATPAPVLETRRTSHGRHDSYASSSGGGGSGGVVPATSVSNACDRATAAASRHAVGSPTGSTRHRMIPNDNLEDFYPDETPSVRRRRAAAGYMAPTESFSRKASNTSVGDLSARRPHPSPQSSSVRRNRGGPAPASASAAAELEDEYDELMASTRSDSPRRPGHSSVNDSSSAYQARSAPSRQTQSRARVVQPQSQQPEAVAPSSLSRRRASGGAIQLSPAPPWVGDDPTAAAAVSSGCGIGAPVGRSSRAFDAVADDDDDHDYSGGMGAPPAIAPEPPVASRTANTSKSTATTTAGGRSKADRSSGGKGRKSAGAREASPDSVYAPALGSSPRGQPRATAPARRAPKAGGDNSKNTNGNARSRSGSSQNNLATISVSDVDDEDEDTFAVSLSPLTSGARTGAASTHQHHQQQQQPRRSSKGPELSVTSVEEVHGDDYYFVPGNDDDSDDDGDYDGAATPAPRSKQPKPAARPSSGSGGSAAVGRKGKATATTSNTKSHRLGGNNTGNHHTAGNGSADNYASARKIPGAYDDTPMSELKRRAALEEQQQQRQQQATPFDPDATGYSYVSASTTLDRQYQQQQPAVYVPLLPLSDITERRNRELNDKAGNPQYTLPLPGDHDDDNGDDTDDEYAYGPSSQRVPLTGTGTAPGGMYGDMTNVTISPMSDEVSTLPSASPKPRQSTAAGATASGHNNHASNSTSHNPSSAALRRGSAPPESSTIRSVAVDAPSPPQSKPRPEEDGALSSLQQRTDTTPSEGRAGTNGRAARRASASANGKGNVDGTRAAAAARPKRRGFDEDAAAKGGAQHQQTKSEQKGCCAVM